MKTTKKALSVLLAVIMIMSSMSVCFGTISFAADDTGAVSAFVTAMKCDAMKNFSTTGGGASNSGSGANQTTTKTFTYTAPSYAYYEQVSNVIAKLDAAIEGLDEYKNGSGHNSDSNCQDGWGKGTATDKCTDLGWIRRHLEAALGTELTTLKQTYNLDALLNAVLNMDGVSYRNADNDLDGDDTTTQNSVKKEMTTALVVTTNKVAEKLLTFNSIAEVPDNVETTTTYTLKMFRQNFTTKNGCNDVNHYHYAMNTNQSGGTPTITKSNGSTNKKVLTDAESVFAQYAAYINTADVNAVLALSADADALTVVSEAITSAKNSVIKGHSEAVYNHFFDETTIAAGLKNVDDAIQFLGFRAIVDELNRLNAINYDSYNEAQLLEHLTKFEEEYKQFTDLEAATQKLIVDSFGLDTASIEATLADIRHDYEVYGIRNLKVQIDTHINMYNSWTLDDVDEGEVTAAELTKAASTLATDVENLGKYVEANVVEVCGATYKADLAALKAKIDSLGRAAGYNEQFLADYAKYRDEIENAVNVNSDTLLESLKNYDVWYAGLKALITTMVAELGQEDADKLFDELNGPMVEYMDNAYVVLKTRTEVSVNTAYDLFEAYKKAHGTNVTMATVSEYKAMQNSIGLINVDAINFLQETSHIDLDPTIISKYNALQEKFPKYEEFLSTMGFSTFQTSTIGDIVREDTTDDIARDNEDIDNDGIGEYVTTDAKIEKVIKIIDTALSNGDIQAALGLDLGTMLKGLIQDALFTDSFINTVVKMLYPIVLSEFIKVWANDLPTEAMGMKVNFNKDLQTVLGDAGFELFPANLAKVLDSSKYSENIKLLNGALASFRSEYKTANDALYTTRYDEGQGKNVAVNTPWDAPSLYKVDDEGNVTTELALDWGVADKKAELEADGEFSAQDQAAFESFFYNAFDDAVEGLKPLLLALIANKTWNATKVEQLAYVTLLGKIWVSLDLNASANSGYANLLVPIYEALGVEYVSVSDVETKLTKETNDVAAILEAILQPIFGFIDMLAEKPLDTILSALPNLCYALSAQMVKPLLNKLQTSIHYAANASIGCDIEAASGDAVVKVGDMLITNDEGALLKEAMFSDGLNSLLASFGISIPPINQGLVATLGDLVQINTQRKESVYTGLAAGKAYHINANKADVLVYLVDYLLDALPELLTTFGLELPETVSLILENISTNPDAVVAALVELLNLGEYETYKLYEWYDGKNYQASPVVGFNPAIEIYLNPGNDWSREKAEYIYENADALVGAVLAMLPAKEGEEKAESLSAMLEGLLGGLFTNETLTAIAKLLGGLDLNALLAGDAAEEEAAPEEGTEELAEGEEAEGEATEEEKEPIDVNALVNNLLGINLGAFAQYKDLAEGEVIDFGVTDIDSFVAALAGLLEPFSPVLEFLLNEGDLTIFDGEGAITLPGYDGYGTAIAPLLYALGCDVAAVGEDGALAAVLGAFAGKIKAIIANPVEEIFGLLPGVLYFLASNGLSVAVRNLLQPVYVILDTIRPIYDLDLNELLGGLIKEATKDEEFFFDLDALDVNLIIDLVSKLTGLNLTGLKTVIYDAAAAFDVVEYESISDLEEQTWKTAEYAESFDEADVLTVILSFVLEWITVDANAQALDALLKTDGIIPAIKNVFASVEIEYGTPNWMYWFATEAEFNDYVTGQKTLPNTLAALTYPNDWSEAKAEYFANNIATLADKVIELINKDKEDAPKSVAELLGGLINGYISGETLDMLVGLITGLLEEIDDNLIDAAGRLLNVNIVGLKSYKAPEGIDTTAEFAAELANVLTTYAGGLINWLFFGEDYAFAKKSDNTDTIIINGGEGYEKGLALVLEALGCELPEEATVASIFAAIAARVDEILAAPVNEALDLLPNLIYFLNANGAGVAVGNILAPVYALLGKLEGLGVELDLTELLGFDLKYLSLEDILGLVEEMVGLDLEVAEDILVDLCIGKIEKGTYTYKMTADRKDTITVLLTTALLLVSDDEFAAKLDEMLGTEIIAAIETVFGDVEITYAAPTWDYPLADNGTVDTMQYAITYPNNWTEETAEYIADALPEIADIVAGMIDSNYTSLSALLKDKANIFTTETLESLIGLISDLLGDIDEELLGVGVILDVDLVGLKNHEVKEGITTVDAFAAELANILGKYASGVVEWLLLGKDFTFFVSDADGKGSELIGTDIITINGAHGYSEGLALLLEALGCENLPTVEGNTTEEILNGVFASLAARIDAIFANPVEEVINLLPNLLYFLNTNGVAAVVDNTIAAVTALLGKLEAFGIQLDINELVNLQSLMGIEGKDATISLDNLAMKDILQAVSLMTGLDLTLVENVLVGFALGKIDAYESVSTQVGTPKKMSFVDEFDKHDMVTVLANLVLITLVDEGNAEFVKNIVGEDIYAVIINILNIEEFVAEMQDISWIYKDYADKDIVISPIDRTDLFEGDAYGEYYTEDMANYIVDNFGEFVDNIIYLLGLDLDGDGDYARDLAEVLESLDTVIDGSLYNSELLNTILGAIQSIVAQVDGLADAKLVAHVKAIVKEALGVDLNYWNGYAVAEFANNREMFVSELCRMLTPLYPVLGWLLGNEDISFFVDEDNTDLITLVGAEGYAYGIIPLLEALGCDNVVTSEDYYAALDNGDKDVLLTSILNPLLDRVDEILANPAEEVFNLLPALIYFINSDGLDTVVKNTLNAVYTVLKAIEPVAKVDLYAIVEDAIGLNIDTLDFEGLFDFALGAIKEATGIEFASFDASALVELTTGKVVSFTSANGETAYTMVYASEAHKAETITVLARLIVSFIATEGGKNADSLVALLKENLGMDDAAAENFRGFLQAIIDSEVNSPAGMDKALALIYYVFYGADFVIDQTAGAVKDFNVMWKEILETIGRDETNPGAITAGNLLADILDITLGGVIDSEGAASNGFISFFQKIAAFFQRIMDWFRNLFS